MTRPRKAHSGQIINVALESSLQKMTASLEGLVQVVPELQALNERMACQQNNAAERNARLDEALSGIIDTLHRLGSETGGLQREMAGLRQDVSEQLQREVEAMRTVMSAKIATVVTRFDDIERQLATVADEVSGARKTARDQFAVGLELQALASGDMDTKLAHLELRMGTSLRRNLEERLPTWLRQEFFELTKQLTQAIGVAMADRELTQEIAANTEQFDVWKAMAVLGLSEFSTAEPLVGRLDEEQAEIKIAVQRTAKTLAGETPEPPQKPRRDATVGRTMPFAIGVNHPIVAAPAGRQNAVPQAAPIESAAPAVLPGSAQIKVGSSSGGREPFAIRIKDPHADRLEAGNAWFVNGHSGNIVTTTEATETEPITLNSSPFSSAKVTAPPKRTSEVLITLDLEETWERRGWPQGETALEPGGRVTAKAACSHLGFVGPALNCAGGGLVEVDVELGKIDQAQGAPVLRLRTETGFPVGPDWPLQPGINKRYFFAPYRTKQLKFYIFLNDAPSGFSFTIKKISLSRIDAEAHWNFVKHRRSEIVLASMASIPSRRNALRDSVNSLLLQCDRVRVFLNNYPDIPEFLEHPRIEVRRSQDWDDRGDAGKFFWIDKDRDESGYRLTVDDDLIFPPDFADVMTAKVAEFGNRAIVSMHGILLRQPVAQFYDRASRAATFHFAYPIDRDRFIHIGGTGVMCFHASTVTMGWDDFKYCNSGDLWIGLYAQRNGLPILTPARKRNWIVENQRGQSDSTIYDQSFKRSRNRFDSSRVQDAVLRHAWPVTVKPADRAKVGVAIRFSDPRAAVDSANHWLSQAQTCGDAAEIVFLLVYDDQDSALSETIAGLTIPYETHLISSASQNASLGTKLDAMRAKLGLNALLVVTENVFAEAAYAPLVSDGATGAIVLLRSGSPDSSVWSTPTDKHRLAFALSHGERGQEALATFLGGGELAAIGLPTKRRRTRFALNDIAGGTASEEVDQQAKALPQNRGKKRLLSVNDVFKRVVVLNLDRRPDRLKKVTQQLSRAGIIAERFSAVDGQAPAVADEYAAYAAGPLHKVSPEIPRIAYSRDLYMDYPSQMARIAHLEEKSGRKAIASAGAWGYLRSYEAIIERSLDDQDETLLVFDDDIALHKDFGRLFDEAVSQLPDDWLILQLGTLQYNWHEPFAQWRTPMLYQTNGSAVGSHAVGMRFEILPFLLDHTKRMDMPYDIGALSAATRAFPNRCFVIYPNLAIQALDISDIGTSEFQKSRNIDEVAAIHRWNLDDYIDSARHRQAER